MPREIGLVIIEDSEFIRDSLELHLRRAHRDGGSVRHLASFSNPEDAIEELAKLQPEVILMDLTYSLASMDGVSATRLIKRRFPFIKIVVYTVEEAGDRIKAALQAGADAYIDKASPPDVLDGAITRVADGGRALSARAGDALIKHHHDTPADHKALSPQEQRVLDETNRGLQDKQIAANMQISEHTLREYKRRICDKTGCSTVRQAAWHRSH